MPSRLRDTGKQTDAGSRCEGDGWSRECPRLCQRNQQITTLIFYFVRFFLMGRRSRKGTRGSLDALTSWKRCWALNGRGRVAVQSSLPTPHHTQHAEGPPRDPSLARMHPHRHVVRTNVICTWELVLHWTLFISGARQFKFRRRRSCSPPPVERDLGPAPCECQAHYAALYTPHVLELMG